MKLNKKYKFAWQTIYSEEICEIYCNYSFDAICVDLEHSSINISECLKLIRIIQLYKKLAFVRISNKNSENLKKVLDFGVDGIIVPDVRNIKDCKSIINNMYYSPIGNRGVGLQRANLYGNNFQHYLDFVSKRIVFIPMIESKEAIKNINQILSYKYTNGVMIGPYDLSSSLGFPGDFDNLDFVKSIKSIIKKSKKNKKHVGLHIIEPDIKLIKKSYKEGYSFLVYSLDSVLFNSILKKLFK